MKEGYRLYIGSSANHSLKIVYDLLNLQSVQENLSLFPATYPVSMTESKVLKSIHDFNLDDRSNELDSTLSSFFTLTSANDISFNLTIQKRGLPHKLEIKMPFINPIEHGITISNITEIIKEIIPVFVPDFAVLQHIVKKPPLKRKIIQIPSGAPYAIRLEWLTYFGKPFLDYVGIKRFEGLDSLVVIKNLHNGLLIQLQPDPFDLNNPKHLDREKHILRKLRLDDLTFSK